MLSKRVRKFERLHYWSRYRTRYGHYPCGYITLVYELYSDIRLETKAEVSLV